MPTNCWDRQNAALLEFDPKPSEAAFSAAFELRQMPIGSSWWRNIWWGRRLGRYGCPCNMWRAWVKQWQKELTLWPTGPILRITFVQYLIPFCRRTQVTSDIKSGKFMGPVFPGQPCDIRWSSLDRFREIPPEAVGLCGGIFTVASDQRKKFLTSYPVRL